MELTELVNAIEVVEITAKTRPAAIRALVRAAHWEAEGIDPDEVLEAVEEREATARTIVAPGFALPHGKIKWNGNYKVVLGRSRTGVDYGGPGGTQVQLIVLWVVGSDGVRTHLEVLAALADLFKSEEFRQTIIDAPDTRNIELLLRQRVGSQAEPQPRTSSTTHLSSIMVRQAIQLVETLGSQALLLAVGSVDNVPWKALNSYQGRLLIVTADRGEDSHIERPDTHLIDVPHDSLSRMDRANLGLLLAASAGLLNEPTSVVCVTGPEGKKLDSITVTKPDSHLQAMFAGKGKRAGGVNPAVVMRILTLAIELAAEGREARPIGAMFVIGDVARVIRHTRQLVFNPFHGYSRQLRNVLDPSLAETIKEFALIDGGFLVHGDGTVHSAGTYLVPKSIPDGLPHGLGTRHQTAAGITSHTESMAITVSQSTGAVSVFRHGAIVLTLERAAATRF